MKSAVALTLALLSAAPASAAAPPVELAPGLVLRDLGRGESPAAKRWRVVAGTFESQREADARLAALRAAGESPRVAYRGGAYEISVAELPDRAAAEAAAAHLEAAGIGGAFDIVEYGADVLSASGPWSIHLLEADPRRVRADVVHSLDAPFGLETTRELAARHGAAAAVNGGFYVVRGPLAGDATGLLVIDGELWSEPDRGRGAVGFDERDGVTDALFGRVAAALRLAVEGGEAISLDGVHRARGENEVILYTPAFHRTTLTAPGGVEAIVAGGEVRALRRDGGSSAIPADGFVVSAGAGATARLAKLSTGARVRVETTWSSSLGDPAAAWSGVDDATSAGPVLVAGGRAVEDWSAESISRVFCEARHPRTAVGERADGTLLLVVVDGRRPETSVGMSCGELAALLVELGAESAVNLDGGGSTTMVAGGRVVNAPSDTTGERANGDAVLLFTRTRGDSE